MGDLEKLEVLLEEARDRGYEEGYTDGFENRAEIMTSTIYQDGWNDCRAHFKNKGLLRQEGHKEDNE